jgi:hypothetical protein
MSLASLVSDRSKTAAKEGEKELTIAAITSRLQVIEDITRPLFPLCDQEATIEATLVEQG